MSDIIDLKFKDLPPEETVKKIRSILASLNITVEERWNDSGIENCCSVNVCLKDGFAFSTGKGITKALARASAYAEFIERLQQGLHYYKLPSLSGIPNMDLQTYAPDGKYMSLQEVIDNGEWMEYLIEAYGSKVTRNHIAKLSKAYACTDEDKILTIPFYSLFEDKYIYIPAAFATQMYTSNGCCAGNTPEEAFVHAISEIFERNCKDKLLLSGFSAPKLPDCLLNQFPTVSKIIATLRESGNFDVSIFDISYETGYPVVATRIIDKQTHNYVVNAAADPVLEIAIQRTLTETFQGRTITSIRSGHNGLIVNNISDIPLSPNIRNMRETSSGIYAANFFCDSDDNFSTTQFPDNRNKSNTELLQYVVEHCRKLNRPIYIRNYSYLGFTCYKVIIPGYSEGFWPQLLEPTSEYALGNEVAKFFRDITSATKNDISLMLLYTKKVSNYIGIANNFSRLSGVPIPGKISFYLAKVTFAHSFYILGKFNEALSCSDAVANCDFISNETRKYFRCLSLYLKLKIQGIPNEQLRTIIAKFNEAKYAEALFELLDANKSPFENFLIKCDYKSCKDCRYRDYCSYEAETKVIKTVGPIYRKFAGGQNKENFPTA